MASKVIQHGSLLIARDYPGYGRTIVGRVCSASKDETQYLIGVIYEINGSGTILKASGWLPEANRQWHKNDCQYMTLKHWSLDKDKVSTVVPIYLEELLDAIKDEK